MANVNSLDRIWARSLWKDPRSLVRPSLFVTMAVRLQEELRMRDIVVTGEEAERRLAASLGFLQLQARFLRRGFRPTREIDLGWKVFLGYTIHYEEFCKRLRAGFIHHIPDDDPAYDRPESSEAVVALMRELRIPFEADLWHADDPAPAPGAGARLMGDGGEIGLQG